MKILQFGKYYPPHLGGIETVIHNLTEGLNRIPGISCDVLCANKTAVTAIETYGKYKVIRAARLFEFASTAISPSLVWQLWKMRKEYDIIHLHFPDPMAVLALFLVRPAVPLVVHWHSDIVKQKFLFRFFRPFQNYVLRKAETIIVTSPPYASSSPYLKNYRDKIQIIPIGVSYNTQTEDYSFTDSLRQKYRNKKIILSIGRNTAYKGFKYLIAAAGHLPDNYVVIIGGHDTDAKDLSQQVIQSNLSDKVILLGSIDSKKLISYYQISTVFVLPSISRNEAFGIVLLEAMTCGLPLVTTKIQGSGVSWVNKNKITGLCVAPEDPLALRDAIVLIAESPGLQKKFRDNARKIVSRKFKPEVMIKKVLQLYHKLQLMKTKKQYHIDVEESSFIISCHTKDFSNDTEVYSVMPKKK